MIAPDPHNQASRELLRGYLLDTLEPEDRARVESYLAESESWREALNQQQHALRQLDILPDAAPSQDLTAAVTGSIPKKQRSFAPVGLRLALGAAVVVIAAAIVVPSFTRAREAARRSSVQNTLKQWGIVFKMYAGENKDFYPPLTQYEDYWVPDLRALYPKYVADPTMLVNVRVPNARALQEEIAAALEADPPDWETATRIFAESFTYSGYALRNPVDVNGIETARLTDRDEYTASSRPTIRVYRLRDGIERFFITDINNPGASTVAQSDLPVMFEALTTVDGRTGVNVLYMDGHVDFIPTTRPLPPNPTLEDILIPPK